MVKAGKWLRSLLGGRKSSRTENTSKEKLGDQKKDRRRWGFGRSKARSSEGPTEHAPTARDGGAIPAEHDIEQNKHAMAVAAATAAAAEAAVAAAQAAAAVVRLTSSNGRSLFNGGVSREEWAAIRIQTAFRGYLARRALRALKGLVKLQALVRGHIVRKQASITLRCMQALVRVQARVRARRVRMSEEGQAVQRQLFQRRQQEIRPRRSMDRWNSSSGSAHEVESKAIASKQNAAKREIRGTANGYSEQNGISEQARKGSGVQSAANSSLVIDCEPDKAHWGWTWLDRWMAARPWESPFLEELMMNNSNNEESQAKIVEMDTAARTITKRRNGSMSENASVDASLASTPCASHPAAATSPFAVGRSPATYSHTSPTRSPTAAATIHELMEFHNARAAAAAAAAEEEDGSILSTAQSSPRYGSTAAGGAGGGGKRRGVVAAEDYYPSYMASTKSAKAKVRSHSAPKQRPDPAAEKAAKKRLSLHEGSRAAAAAAALAAVRMQRSSSQVRSAVAPPKGFSHSSGGPTAIRLDRSSMSLRDSDTASFNGDFRRAFK